MPEDSHVELSEREKRELALLKKDQPPPGLEGRVLGALKERGLLRAAPSSFARTGRVAAVLAACLLLFASGAFVGLRLVSPAPAPTSASSTTGERFVLLLFEGSTYRLPEPGKEMERVDEYRTWARTMAREGSLIGGEKLKDEEELLGGPGPVTEPGIKLGGYFIIVAPDSGAAKKIASGCPHLRHGGRILIRPIDPV